VIGLVSNIGPPELDHNLAAAGLIRFGTATPGVGNLPMIAKMARWCAGSDVHHRRTRYAGLWKGGYPPFSIARVDPLVQKVPFMWGEGRRGEGNTLQRRC
jgi:hypothetical protein